MNEKTERNDEIVYLYTNPPYKSIIDIAERYNMTRQAVFAILSRRGVPINRLRRNDGIITRSKRDAKIIRLHSQGKSASAIIKDMTEFRDISRTTVYRVLKKNGIS